MTQGHKLSLLLSLSIAAVLAVLTTLGKRRMGNHKRPRLGPTNRVRARRAIWKRLASATRQHLTEESQPNLGLEPARQEHNKFQSEDKNLASINNFFYEDSSAAQKEVVQQHDMSNVKIIERVRIRAPSLCSTTQPQQNMQREEHASIDATRSTPQEMHESALPDCMSVDINAHGVSGSSENANEVLMEERDAQLRPIGAKPPPFEPDLTPQPEHRTTLRATAAPFVPSFLQRLPVVQSPTSGTGISQGDAPTNFLLDSTPSGQKFWNWTWYDGDETMKAMVAQALQDNGANEDGSLRAVIEDEFRTEIEELWQVGLQKWEKRREETQKRLEADGGRRWAADGHESVGFTWTMRESTKNGRKVKKSFEHSSNWSESNSSTPRHIAMKKAFSSLYEKHPNTPSTFAPNQPPQTPRTPEPSAGDTFVPSVEGFWPADSIRDRAYVYLNKRTETQQAAEEAHKVGDLEKATELVVAEHRAYEIGVLFHDAAAALLFFVKNEGYFSTVQEAMGSWTSGLTKKVKAKRMREWEQKRCESGSSEGERHGGNDKSSLGSGEEDLSIDVDANATLDTSNLLEPLPLPTVNTAKLRKCDLHGLLIREARHYVLQHLELCRAHHVGNTDIVTGWGKSSKDNDAKLKPRVKEILEKYEAESEGRMLIDRRKKNDGLFTLRMSGW